MQSSIRTGEQTLNAPLIVFPTQRAIRAHLATFRTKNQVIPKMITIGELFSRLLSLPHNTMLIDSDIRVYYLFWALQSIDSEKIGITKKIDSFFTQSEYIFGFFQELANELTSIDNLIRGDTYDEYGEHLKLLGAIQSAYRTILAENKLIDTFHLPFEANFYSGFLKNFSSLEIKYEGYFSQFETKLIKKIQSYIPTSIELTIDQHNSKNCDIFKAFNLFLEPNYHYIVDISNCIIKEKIPLQRSTTTPNFYPHTTKIEQIGGIKQAIYTMIQNGIDPHKIAVVLPDEKFATHLALFDSEKYFNFAMGKSITDTIIPQAIEAISDAILYEEPQYKQRLLFFHISEEFFDTKIYPFWKKRSQSSHFFELFDFLLTLESDLQIIQVLQELRVTLQNLFTNRILEETLTLKNHMKILQKKLHEITLDDTHGGPITVLGILETRYSQFDGVIVADFTDDMVPKKSIKDKFLSTTVKKNSHLPTHKEREGLQKYYYKKLFDNAKAISLCYIENKEKHLSRFAEELFVSPKPKSNNFGTLLTYSKPINYQETPIELPYNLATFTWSATTLRIFLECKLQYYYYSILKIKEHPLSLKPQGYEIGNIIHTTLENNYKNRKYSYKEMIDTIETYKNKNPFLDLDLSLWQYRLEKFFQYEQIRFDTNISVHKLETPFSFVRKGIKLIGKIDRIDRNPDGTYTVLDYKTSQTLQIDTNKTYEKSVDFQLELYFLATKDLGVSKVGYYDLYSGIIKDEVMLEPKIAILDTILDSLHTNSVSFEKTQDLQKCTFCSYRTICQRA